MDDIHRRLNVCDEWSDLQDVVLGTMEQAIYPGWYSGFQHIKTPSLVKQIRQAAGKKVADLEPERYAGAIDQTENLAELLTQQGIRVHRPRPLSQLEIAHLADCQPGVCLQYPRDPILVIGKTVIELAMRGPYRRKDCFSLRPILDEFVGQTEGARHFAMNPPNPTDAANELDPDCPILEGGDIFVLGKDVMVGLSGQASNRKGVAWLQQMLGPAYRVHGVRLQADIEHLDCALLVAGPGMGAIYRNAFLDGLPEPIQDWILVEATEEEARSMGVNALCLAPGKVIMSATHKRLIKALEQHNIDVIDVPYDDVNYFTGGVRCSTHPLCRFS